jgi:hypothetical protein
MIRFAFLAALAHVAIVSARADAQPAPGTFQIVDAKIDGERLLWSEEQIVYVARQVEVVVMVNGMMVTEKRTEMVPELRTITKAAAVKELKASDAAGKAIDADKLAELLKEKAPVILVTGPVAEKHRALFKDKTVFIQLPAPKAPVLPPVGPAPKL